MKLFVRLCRNTHIYMFGIGLVGVIGCARRRRKNVALPHWDYEPECIEALDKRIRAASGTEQVESRVAAKISSESKG